jgi:hypothetical protein
MRFAHPRAAQESLPQSNREAIPPAPTVPKLTAIEGGKAMEIPLAPC